MYTGPDPDGEIEAFLEGDEDKEVYHHAEVVDDNGDLIPLDDEELLAHIRTWLIANDPIRTVLYE